MPLLHRPSGSGSLTVVKQYHMICINAGERMSEDAPRNKKARNDI